MSGERGSAIPGGLLTQLHMYGGRLGETATHWLTATLLAVRHLSLMI